MTGSETCEGPPWSPDLCWHLSRPGHHPHPVASLNPAAAPVCFRETGGAPGESEGKGSVPCWYRKRKADPLPPSSSSTQQPEDHSSHADDAPRQERILLCQNWTILRTASYKVTDMLVSLRKVVGTKLTEELHRSPSSAEQLSFLVSTIKDEWSAKED